MRIGVSDMVMDVMKGMQRELAEHVVEAVMWEHMGSQGDAQSLIDEIAYMHSFDYAIYIIG